MDKSKTASFDVDCQKTFTPLCPDELPVPGGDEIVAELNAQAAYAAFRIGSKEGHSPRAIWVKEDQNAKPMKACKHVDLYWVEHAVPGTEGFESLNGLPKPADYNYFVWKGIELDMHPYGSCYHDLANKVSTGVIEFLKVHGINTVIVGGLATDYCVKETVMQLLDAGFAVILNLGASRGLTQETTEKAVEAMRQKGAKMVTSASELKDL